jgi:uncharacterized caspase-like protein
MEKSSDDYYFKNPALGVDLMYDKAKNQICFSHPNTKFAQRIPSELKSLMPVSLDVKPLGPFLSQIKIVWVPNIKYLVGIYTLLGPDGQSSGICLITVDGKIVSKIDNCIEIYSSGPETSNIVSSPDAQSFAVFGDWNKGNTSPGSLFRIAKDATGMNQLLKMPGNTGGDVRLDFSPIVLSSRFGLAVSSDLESGRILDCFGSEKYNNADVFTFHNVNIERRCFDLDDNRKVKVDQNGVFTELGVLDFSSKGVIFACPDNFYMSQKKASAKIHFVKGLEAFPLERFDLRLNRPDIVLGRLGAPRPVVDLAAKMRKRRLSRMGISEEVLLPDYHSPSVKIDGSSFISTTKRSVTITINAEDNLSTLSRLKIFVNNVPINGIYGEQINDGNTNSFTSRLSIDLGVGANKIQVSVTNSAGAESDIATVNVECRASVARPNLYVASMGVSEYYNTQANLRYAAKDAKDFVNTIAQTASNFYGEVKTLVLTDRDCTNSSMTRISDFLKDATIDDAAILFLAGHGTLDTECNYYFATSDMDFSRPDSRGISFDAIDDLMASLKSRKKVLLIDTCHAGELDSEDKTAFAAAHSFAGGSEVRLTSTVKTELARGVSLRAVGTRGLKVSAVTSDLEKSDWYETIEGLFVDLRRGSGTSVLSSSKGGEYAFESDDQKNGLFTYSLIEALKNVDLIKGRPDNLLKMSDVSDYVVKRVRDLTKGQQTPNLRRINLDADVPFASMNR